MWVLMENGNAINNEDGSELYTSLGIDGIIRVYHDTKPIFFCKNVSDAKNFIKNEVILRNEKLGVSR